MGSRLALHRPVLRTIFGALGTYGAFLLLTPADGEASPAWFAAGLLYTHVFEYLMHRVLMHHGLPRLGFIQRQHLEHHRIFYGERMQSRDPQDLRYVLTGAPNFALLFVLHYGIFLLAFPARFAPAFFAGVTLHFLAYETLHWFTHIEDNALDRLVSRIPVLGAVRARQIQHHHWHHAIPVVNFNFTPPYGGDRCAGTLAVPQEKLTARNGA